jgi:hypothetical protein
METIRTPWGASQYSSAYGEGITFHGTAGHGGFKVERALNAKIPAYMRAAGGWYEEDCEWAKVAVVFPERFDAETATAAKKSLADYDYKAYEKFYGIVLKPGESYEKDKEAAQEKFKNHYQTLSAFGDWHPQVPKGFVVVFAGKGGRLPNGMFPDNCKHFLVKATEYEKRQVGVGTGFVVNPKRHKEVPDFDKYAR